MQYLNFFKGLLWGSLLVICLTACTQNNSVKTTEADTSVVKDPLSPPEDVISTDTILPPKDSSTPVTPPDPNNDFRIVPAKSVGKIDLGMDQDVAIAALGTPDSSYAAMGTIVYTWLGKTKPYRSELNIVTGYADSDMKKRSVKMIRTTSPYFLTVSGIGVQKNLAEIKQKYPMVKLIKTYSSINHRATTDMWADEGAGILFECLSNDQKLCVGVQVFKPGKLPGMEF